MSLSSVTGLPTGTGVTLTVDATNASGVATPTLKETMTGVVSGTTISNLIRGQDGTTAQAHATGANVVMWITANLWNDFQSAFLKNHEQLHGNHLSLTDANGNNWIDQSATANAVNRLQVANAATGGDVVLSAVGSDANINIDLIPKGIGKLLMGSGLANAITSYTNTGSVGGTFYYVNLGGIKLLWGTTTGQSVSGGNGITNYPINFPASFFTANPTVIPGALANGQQYVIGGSATTSGVTIIVQNAQSIAVTNEYVSIFVIGT
jgi:phosphotransferase system HPr-like phosphotransfer protein